LYRSFDSNVVLGRWSYAYAAVLVGAVVACIGILATTWRASLRSAHASPSIAARLTGMAALAWGAAYLWTSVADPASAGRFTNLNFFGSTLAVPALLDWLAIAFFAVAAMTWCAKRLPSKLQNAGLVVATLVVLVVLGEGIARIATIAFPGVQGFPTYSTQLWRDRHVTLNALGYRDAEHSLVAAAGVRRALVVGDSYAFGTGTDDVDDRFGEQLGLRLSSDGGGSWEVINAGRPDTHTLEHIDALRPMLAYAPELVVLLYSFNDMDYLAPITPRAWTSGDETILARLHPVPVLFQNSYLFQQIYVRLRKAVFAVRGEGPSFDTYGATDLTARHYADLARFVSIAHDGGAVVRIVPFDNFLKVTEANERRYRKFVTEAEGAGLPICSLERAFEGHPVTALRVNSLDGHGSPLAYALAVEAAFDCLVAQLPPPRSR
jgi:hypothetical protein